MGEEGKTSGTSVVAISAGTDPVTAERSERLVAALNAASESVALIDHQGRLIVADPSFYRLLGISESQEQAANLESLGNSRIAAIVAENFRTSLSAQRVDFRLVWSDEVDGWLAVRSYPVDEGVLVCATPIDPQAHGQSGAGLAKREDTKTSLPNRLAFDHDLRAFLDLGIHFAIARVDVDRFREINDNFGHREGDRVLVRMAAALKRALVPGDEAYRLDAASFALLIRAEGAELQRRLDQVSMDTYMLLTIGASEYTMHTSIGYVQSPLHGRNAPELLRRAEIALDEYKRREPAGSGHATRRPRVLGFHVEHEREIQRRSRLSVQLGGAIASGQLGVLYQPQFDLRQSRLAGVEALVRWNHPDLGVLTPSSFLPLAASNGMLPAIDMWVAERVVQDLPRLIEAGVRQRVSLNLSAESLASNQLQPALDRLLSLHPAASRSLQFEVTETAVMRQFDENRRTIQQLRDRGMRVVLDDFGTGYSSFEYLLNFPVDAAKIDAVFIQALPQGMRAKRLVRGMIRMLQSLELEVVAEGAENAEQVGLLRDFGCDRMQGFAYAPPLPLSELVGFVREARG